MFHSYRKVLKNEPCWKLSHGKPFYIDGEMCKVIDMRIDDGVAYVNKDLDTIIVFNEYQLTCRIEADPCEVSCYL